MVNVNNIEYKFYIEKLYVRQHDGLPNSVSRVEWMCVMKRNGAKLFAGGRTDLDIPSPNGFIDISSLEAQQVIDWVIQKMGGDEFLVNYLSAHDAHLKEQEKDAGLEAWKIPLVNPLKFDPENV